MPKAAFVDDVARDAYRISHVGEPKLQRAAKLGRGYQDCARLGLVDAAPVALCERLEEAKLAALDRRRFLIERPHRRSHLTPVPD